MQAFVVTFCQICCTQSWRHILTGLLDCRIVRHSRVVWFNDSFAVVWRRHRRQQRLWQEATLTHQSEGAFFLPQTDFHSLMSLSSVCLQIDGRENRSSCWLPWLCARQTGRGSFEGSAEKEEANSLGVWRLSLVSCLCLPSFLPCATTLGSSTVKMEPPKLELASVIEVDG